MLPPDVHTGSNDVRSRAKSYHESIGVKKHGHGLMSIAVPERRTHQQVLREDRNMLWAYLNELDGRIPIQEQLIPCADGTHCGKWEHVLHVDNLKGVGFNVVPGGEPCVVQLTLDGGHQSWT